METPSNVTIPTVTIPVQELKELMAELNGYRQDVPLMIANADRVCWAIVTIAGVINDPMKLLTQMGNLEETAKMLEPQIKSMAPYLEKYAPELLEKYNSGNLSVTTSKK